MKPKYPLRATYRVQFNPAFDFPQAAQIIPYLHDLGISHLYCSPYLQAAPGSTHGYDVVNYHQVNEELGGEEELGRLTQALHSHKMGQVLDIVPNHMAIAGSANPWWWDVLEHGPASRYASYFDVEWGSPSARHANVVLVPTLGDQFGRALEKHEIQVRYDGRAFTVNYFENAYPIDLSSAGLILNSASEKSSDPRVKDRLVFLGNAFTRLLQAAFTDRDSARQRYQDSQVLLDFVAREYAENGESKAAIEQAISDLNADPDLLEIFLDLQNYRLAFWRITQRELGYRRFFDINTMIGLRMEDERVFLDSHVRILGWLHDGSLDGVRVDHPDGLRDPLEYFRRLRTNAPDAWMVVEKILEMGEKLPDDWPIQGTTGYDFLNRVNGLFIDPAAEAALTQFYEEFTGQTQKYADLIHDSSAKSRF